MHFLLEIEQLHWPGVKKKNPKTKLFMTMMLFVVMETPHNSSSSTCLSLTSVGERELSPSSPKALYFAHVQPNWTFHRLQDGVNTTGLRSASPFHAMWVHITTLLYFLCRRSKSDTNCGESFIEVLEMCFSERRFTKVLVSLSQLNYWANR